VWKDSLSLWTDAAAKAPNNIVSLFGLADTYGALNRPDLAIPVLNRALSLNPTHRDVLHHLSESYKGLGDLGAARDYAGRLTSYYPAFPQGFLTLGDVDLLMGDLEGSKAAYLQALQLDPGSGYALAYLGVVYFKQGRLDLARAYYQRAVSVGGDVTYLRSLLR
jgi:tetratricopeptide (TPR) repeat protein